MAYQPIDHGFVEGDGQGESPFTGMQKANANFAELYTAKDDALTALTGKAPIANPSFTGTVSGISKAMVGLSSVDNTSDTSKPVSTAQSAAIIAGDNLRLQMSDISHDFVASGLTMTDPTNSLSGTLVAGIAYVNGIRTVKSADTFTYLATRDTYLDMDTAGVLYRAEAVNAVPNGAAAPALVAGRIRLMKIVTSASDITSITQLSSFGAGLVLRYSNKASFPTTGDTDLLYVDAATNISWRWNGSAYQVTGMNVAGTAWKDPNGGPDIPVSKYSVITLALVANTSGLLNNAAIPWDTIVQDDIGLTTADWLNNKTRLYYPQTAKAIRLSFKIGYNYVGPTPTGTYRGARPANYYEAGPFVAVGLDGNYIVGPVNQSTLSEAIVHGTTSKGLLESSALVNPNDNWVQLNVFHDAAAAAIIKGVALTSPNHSWVSLEIWE